MTSLWFPQKSSESPKIADDWRLTSVRMDEFPNCCCQWHRYTSSKNCPNLRKKCRRSTICECNNGRIANFCCQRHHYDSARNRPNLRKTCRRLAIYERTNERIFRTIAANDITLFPPKIVRISEKCRRSTICECHRGRIANFCCHWHHYDSLRNCPNLRKMQTIGDLRVYEWRNFRTSAANDITTFPPQMVRISEKCRRLTICQCSNRRFASFCCQWHLDISSKVARISEKCRRLAMHECWATPLP